MNMKRTLIVHPLVSGGAISDFDRAIGIDPKMAGVHLNRGMAREHSANRIA